MIPIPDAVEAVHAPSFSKARSLMRGRKRRPRGPQRARSERLRFHKLLWIDEGDGTLWRFYTARRTFRPVRLVTFWRDRDGRLWGSCTCPGNNPPLDSETGVVKWQARFCYHLAGGLIYNTQLAQAAAERVRSRLFGGVRRHGQRKRKTA